MDADFNWDGSIGHVRVECVPNDDPPSLGTWSPAAEGFPVCTATVEYPRRGYLGMFGWVQLVRSSDNASQGTQFEMDPFGLFGDSPSPYCWSGTEPTLFDAPSRRDWSTLTWTAHSFLATTPMQELLRGNPRRVVPVAGFSWGFEVNDRHVTFEEIRPLTASQWSEHLPILRASHPAPFWTFADDAVF